MTDFEIIIDALDFQHVRLRERNGSLGQRKHIARVLDKLKAGDLMVVDQDGLEKEIAEIDRELKAAP